MSTKYRKISPRIWSDSKFCSLSDDAQLLFIFILTHPHMSSVGAMRASIPGLAAEKKWDTERAVKGFAELFRKGLLNHDERACAIVAPNFIRHNPPENPNVVKSWRNAFNELPECSIISLHFKAVKEFLKGFAKGFQEPFAKSMPNQEQEQEQEQEQDKNTYVSQARRVDVEKLPDANCDELPDEEAGGNHRKIENCGGGGDAEPMAVDDSMMRKRDRVSSMDVLHVFRHWQTTMGHLQAKLDVKRKRRIKTALELGYTVSQLCDAVTGCSKTPFNMGENVDGRKYDDIELILRDTRRIEDFIRNCHSPPRPKNKAEKRLNDNVTTLKAWVERSTEGQKND